MLLYAILSHAPGQGDTLHSRLELDPVMLLYAILFHAPGQGDTLHSRLELDPVTFCDTILLHVFMYWLSLQAGLAI